MISRQNVHFPFTLEKDPQHRFVRARLLATQPITEHTFLGIDPLPYHAVGVHKRIGLMGDTVRIPWSEIEGKAIVDEHCAYSVPCEELNVS